MTIVGRTKYWKNSSGQLHNEDGPAKENPTARDYQWYRNGKRHRMDGPARVMYVNLYQQEQDGFDSLPSYREWWVNGQVHRTDGPAIEMPNGRNHEWRLFHNKVSKSHVTDYVLHRELKVLLLSRVVNPFCEVNVTKYLS
jgi:hypothetical protein